MLFICTSSFTLPICFLFFFFKTTATTEIYTLSLHDALPISGHELAQRVRAERPDLKLIYSSGYSHEVLGQDVILREDRKSTRLNSSHVEISYAVFCLKKKKKKKNKHNHANNNSINSI